MVELLVATICLGMTAIGVLAALHFSDTQNTLSRHRMIATSVANSEIDRYRSKAFYGLVTPTLATVPLPNSGLPQPATLTTTVSVTPDAKVFNVSTEVKWSVIVGSGNTQRAIRLDTAVRNSDAP